MDSIIRLDSKGEIIIEPAATKLVPAFAVLNDKQIRYLVLAYDTANTIFKQQPRHHWRKLACKAVYGHDNVDKVEAEKHLSAILDDFKQLVYDEDREQKIRLTARKRELETKLLSAEGTQAIKTTVESIKMIDQIIQGLDSKIIQIEEEVQLASKTGKLSMLEYWQRKQKFLHQ